MGTAKMALFVGQHPCKIDKKGRTVVPKPFRAAFETQDFRGIYAFPSFKYPAINACTESHMAQLSESLSAQTDFFSDEQDDMSAVILENTAQISIDGDGRLILPTALLDHAGISDELIFVGRGKDILIWEPSAYQAHAANALNRVKAKRPTLKMQLPEDAP